MICLELNWLVYKLFWYELFITQQIEVRLVEITIEYFSRTLPLEMIKFLLFINIDFTMENWIEGGGDRVYNLYYCWYTKTSSSEVQKRHSKVYGNLIAPSFYSILLGLYWIKQKEKVNTTLLVRGLIAPQVLWTHSFSSFVDS